MKDASPRFLVGLGLIAAAVALFLYGAVSGLPGEYVASTQPVPNTGGTGVNLPRLVWDGLTHAAIPGLLLFLGTLFVVQETERKRGDKVG